MIYLVEDLQGNAQKEIARKLLQFGLNLEYNRTSPPVVKCHKLGKPYLANLPGVYFNYSHSEYGVMCGISDSEVGVDIERIIIYRENLARRICHPEEMKLLEDAARQSEELRNRMLSRIWTVKESYLKYLGIGLRRDLRELNFCCCCNDQFEQEGCHFLVLEGERYVAAGCGFEEGVRVAKVDASVIEHSCRR